MENIKLIQNVMVNLGYRVENENKKVVEFCKDHTFIYYIKDNREISIVISTLMLNDYIKANFDHKEYYHSGLRKFPKKYNKGEQKIHYGIMFKFQGEVELTDFLYHLKDDISVEIAREDVFEIIIQYILNDEELKLEYKGKKTRIRFSVNDLEFISKGGDGTWDGTEYLLLFEIENRNESLELQLVIGPGDTDKRIKLYETALKYGDIFNSATRGDLSPKFKRIYRKRLIDWKKDRIDNKNINIVIQGLLDEFKNNDFKLICDAFNKEINLIHKIINDTVTETEKDIIIKSRLGHSRLRNSIIKAGRSKCEVCGIDDEQLLIMSHIKPWSKSNDYERLDRDNVLMLCPLHDKLFDLGLITFDCDGYMITSDHLSITTKERVIEEPQFRVIINENMEMYLAWHREIIFKK